MTGFIKNILLIIFLLIILETQAAAHGVSLPVIVDTDMALDDMRAITMLLNSEVIQVPLFVVSDGIRSPQEGVRNLRAMLKYYNKSNVEVVKGKNLDKPVPEFRNLIKEINVPGNKGLSGIEGRKSSAPEEIIGTIKSAGDPVIYLCLGPLTNLAEALRIDPKIKSGISFLIYFGAHPEDNNPGWNSLRDTEAAHAVFESGLRIYSILLPEKKLLPFNTGLYDKIRKLKTPASSLLERIHETDDIKKLLLQNHFSVWDEMTIIYINDPSLFTFSLSPGHGKVMSLVDINSEGIEEAYLQALGFSADAHLSPRRSVIFDTFPKDVLLFREDVRPIVDEVIDRYGIEEWKACLLTNEFHRHLGIYSLIGAKMGIRAREILEAPFDTLKVISYTGNKPPLSCMNDGLQVSTGASLGRGTIQIIDRKASPEAVFIYENKRLKLTLKNKIWERIKNDISELVAMYNGQSPAYFNHVRKLAIQYWIDLDRKDIFNELMH